MPIRFSLAAALPRPLIAAAACLFLLAPGPLSPSLAQTSGPARFSRDTPTVRSDLCFSILARFRAAGIVMPYPQRELSWRGAMPPKMGDAA